MQYDITIIGGGIVGLASAYHILQLCPDQKLLLLEKESDLAAHQTGHNSGVIHSGIYYKPGSLKAKNCIDGYHMLIDFCKKHDVPFELCGKLIVALDDAELPELEKLYQRGLENGLNQIFMIEKDAIKDYEPHLNGIKAIRVPYTGIIDYTQVCEKLAQEIIRMGGTIQLSTEVKGINHKGITTIIQTTKGDIETKLTVNCAGLYCDKVAEMAGAHSDTRIIPFRGEYFKLKSEKKALVKHLIYPVPNPDFPFLGVHFTRMIDGAVEAGPNAVFAFKREGYHKSDVDLVELFESLAWPGFQKVAMKYWKTGMGEFYRSFSKTAFTSALQRLIPEVQEDDLLPAEAGVRAQACDRTGGLLDDFKIIENEHAIHILNAPSPAATSSLSIGNTIGKLVQNKLS
jgi:L-2-hydroxyglutarate oxidase